MEQFAIGNEEEQHCDSALEPYPSSENVLIKIDPEVCDVTFSKQPSILTTFKIQLAFYLRYCFHPKKNLTRTLCYTLLTLCYIVYLVCAVWYNLRKHQNLHKVSGLLAVSAVGFLIGFYAFVKRRLSASNLEVCPPCRPSSWSNRCRRARDYWSWLKWIVCLFIVIGVSLVILQDLSAQEMPKNLMSGAGVMLCVLFSYVCSKHRSQVKWRPVLWGLVIQFLLALFILRTKVGYAIFNWIGDIITIFLEFSTAGSKFLFGDPGFLDHMFAFKVLPTLVFFSATISVLYYLGYIQAIVMKLAWLMSFTMQTTAAESMNAAANIFVGLTEAPLVIKPYVASLTQSELHAVITGGFASVAGSLIGPYSAMGISPIHLVSAAVMSAPAALAISKLSYPETEVSKTKNIADIVISDQSERNVVEALSNGASNSVKIVANISVNLIAFISFLKMVNFTLGWLGGLVGYDQLSFEIICSYILKPVPFLMGVDWKDCQIVAELIGLKTFLNEFIAYQKLSYYMEMQQLSHRSTVIATYALCGFSNIAAIGVSLGCLGSIAPERKSDVADLGVRALVSGTLACFMTATIAGLLITSE